MTKTPRLDRMSKLSKKKNLVKNEKYYFVRGAAQYIVPRNKNRNYTGGGAFNSFYYY